LTNFCPRCGSARVGAFRFCRSCGFDFDAQATQPSSPPASVPVAAGGTGNRFSRRTIVVAGVSVVFGLVGIGALTKPEPAALAAVPTPTHTALVVAAATAQPSPTPKPTFGPTGQTTKATVVRVVDGDTIVVAFGGQEHKVRYIGMDSPETVDPNSLVQWMGPQASAANAALVAGKVVYLERDVSEVDQFDRLLRYVWLTDGAAWTLVNLELVREGVASAKSYPPDIRYDDLYRVAEAEAQTLAVGLWGPTPAPPALVAPAVPTARPTPKPTPKPAPKAKPAPNCHPSYVPCLPIVADLNCPDVRAMGLAPVRVIGPDDYRLDADHDGYGCE
jgi:micrococcal nuclease